MYDVIIIGAGVSGVACARELARFHLNILVLEKHDDVCSETSKANSGIVHAGYDAKPGSLMAKLNLEGSNIMPKLAKELDIPFIKNGSLVVSMEGDDPKIIDDLYKRGKQNGVKKLEIIDKETLMKIEPNIHPNAYKALYAPTAGIICPFTLTLALAQNACINGVEFKFNQKVETISYVDKIYHLHTNTNVYKSRYVINACGVYGDELHNQISDEKVNIVPRKGEYYLLDKNVGNYIKHTIFQSPTSLGKGVLVAPSVHGNLVVGPTAKDIEDKEDVSCTSEKLEVIRLQASKAINKLPLEVITTFAGLRAHQENHDFIIQETKPGFIDCIAIESPGLTAAPAIGKMVCSMIVDKIKPIKKENFIHNRKGYIHMNQLSIEKRNEYIRKNPKYGKIICRCELISEGEIIDALQGPLPARSLDGLKRRVRTGSGRCQGGFCMPNILPIISKIQGIDIEQITKSGSDSNIVMQHTKLCEEV